MSFMAEYQNNMDSKGRVIVPVKFREALGGKFVVNKGADGNLCLYPMKVWKHLSDKVSKLSITNTDARTYKRYFLGSAVEMEIDNQDRITIPQNLRTYAHLEKEILFIGVGHYIEIWPKTSFEDSSESVAMYQNATSASIDVNFDDFDDYDESDDI